MDKDFIIKQLANHQPVLLPETPQCAAVMVILLTDHRSPLEIVITERSNRLPTYAGDYSFPGGMQDETDVDLKHTAIRELQEELQLSQEDYYLIGELDDFQDRFGHLVRPYVATMTKERFMEKANMSLNEITSLYFFSLNSLDAIFDDPALHEITRRKPSYAFRDGDVFIWGLTATILVHILNILLGENNALGKIPTPAV